MQRAYPAVTIMTTKTRFASRLVVNLSSQLAATCSFARRAFRNVHSDERGGRCGINWTVITLVALSLDIARPGLEKIHHEDSP